ncbi:hypothetical protein FKG94_09730 [Exilibacterium tricleocarpae]|uniref:Cycloisomerase n=1 Tax=Exilibacterium tricleocarpae TaxID=2591008 RepID=A0A545TVW0_9GAMM|nr:hypothetical protein [Exilibacterium tricleocarpae]TQV81360.1 hypothetical protein FKG94_09730 [Exilibacterium tricleocarpae]
MTGSVLPAGALLLFVCLSVSVAAADKSVEPLTQFVAEEARQAVAVDDSAVYVIDNRAIGKYDKLTGKRLRQWRGEKAGPIQHLNSGVVIEGRLYSAHSNYPRQPMTSTIEIWDTETLEHIGTHSFGIYLGSATWVDFHRGHWWVVFANYGTRGGTPGRGPEWTQLVKFDGQWRRQAAWVLPPELVTRFSPYSNSGGGWGPDGSLYLTGHDEAALFRVELPAAGAALVYKGRLPAPIEGQGIAWERNAERLRLYGIRRSSRTVVAVNLRNHQTR